MPEDGSALSSAHRSGRGRFPHTEGFRPKHAERMRRAARFYYRSRDTTIPLPAAAQKTPRRREFLYFAGAFPCPTAGRASADRHESHRHIRHGCVRDQGPLCAGQILRRPRARKSTQAARQIYSQGASARRGSAQSGQQPYGSQPIHRFLPADQPQRGCAPMQAEVCAAAPPWKKLPWKC